MANVDSTVGTVMMSFSWIFYQRPAKGLKPEDKLDYQSSLTGAPGAFTAAGIPPSLSLEKILQNETASPCSIVDLLNYLRYIEHSPEHLEFYLWHEEYVKRFEALTEEEKVRSPAWDSTKPAVPVLSQPFRAEITQIIARYIAPGGARELNISSRDRELAMQALSYTTHPSAVFHLKIDCENYIRHQSHPNFIRWVIANCTEPRMNFAYSLGATLLIFGVLTSLLLTLSSAPRAWRLFGAFFWASGSIMLICAWKGICLVLMAMGHRRLLEPWEIASNDLEDDKASVTNSSFDDVIPDTWDDAPWMIRDKKKPWVRRVFADTVPVEDSEVRWLQDVILIQGLGLAILSTLPFLAVFMAIPPANLL